MQEITILTSVYFNDPQRWTYFEQTISSFYATCKFNGRIYHYIIDNQSPLYKKELADFCKAKGFIYLGSTDPNTYRGYYDCYKALVDKVETDHFIFLEGDHYFFNPYDFITPSLQLFQKMPELLQLHLRGPLVYEQPTPLAGGLITHDGSKLHGVPIDEHNTGWVGRGHTHDSFSTGPGILSTQKVRALLDAGFIPGTPWDFEEHLERKCRGSLIGYLNAQAFCYHIGAAGKLGTGNYLAIGDQAYEEVWSRKILDVPPQSLGRRAWTRFWLAGRSVIRALRRIRHELAWRRRLGQLRRPLTG
jgi:hypothetical protein